MIADSPAGLHVFVVAGEESGDRLGAPLMRALKARAHHEVKFSGVGGAQMEQEGLASLFPLRELSMMGFVEIPTRLLQILRRIRFVADAAVAGEPDVLVIIDSPEFTHRVARRVRKRAPEIPIVDYVSPSVWAWRSGRARAMRRYVDHVLALLPFEPEAHRRLGGPPCSYVGHPLSERVAEMRPSAEEIRRRQSGPPLLLVLLGSRTGEIRRMKQAFGNAIERVRAQVGSIEIVMPTFPHLVETVKAAVAGWSVPVNIVTDTAAKNAAFRAARAALTKSGTSTLELALAGVPMVAAYKVSAVEAMIGRILIDSPSAILANLVLGENVVPEFIQERCTGEALADALIPLLSDTAERRRQVAAFGRLDEIMEIGSASPSNRAAEGVLRHAAPLTTGTPRQ